MSPLPIVLLLAACHPDVWEDTGPKDGPTLHPDIDLDPALVDFGTVDVSTTDPPAQEITIRNEGDAALHILSVTLDDPLAVFGVSTPAYLVVPVGESTTVEASFAPFANSTYTGAVVVASDDPDEPTAEVVLMGTGLGGTVTADPNPLLFTDTAVGCVEEGVVTFTNTGSADVALASVALSTSASELALSSVPGLPEILSPKESAEVRITYTPTDDVPDSALLQVYVQGATSPSAQVTITATATATWRTDTYTWRSSGTVDILLAVDRSSSMSDDITDLENALPYLTEALDALGLDWHLTATVEDDGCIDGDDLWIDSSFSEKAARDALAAMIAWGGYSDDRERAFTLLEAAVEADAAGGCNDGLLRSGATWHLAGMSDEEEQSSEGYAYYVSLFQGMRSDPSDVVFDAIGGPYPYGCVGAQFYDEMYDAVEATGGTFISICTTDWEADFEAWAEAIAASAVGSASLSLSEQAAIGSITVKVNGVPVSGGWSWDEATNAVSFDKGSEPSDGATVEVRYALATECP